MIREFETVVLTGDIEEHSLKERDGGAVADRYGDGNAVEVERVTAEGNTIAVRMVSGTDVRPTGNGEIRHGGKRASVQVGVWAVGGQAEVSHSSPMQAEETEMKRGKFRRDRIKSGTTRSAAAPSAEGVKGDDAG